MKRFLFGRPALASSFAPVPGSFGALAVLALGAGAFVIGSGCGSSSATSDAMAGSSPGASCEAACARTEELCGNAVSDCSATCARELSAAERDCVVAASSCASLQACEATGGTGGSTAGARDGSTGTTPSKVDALVQAWDAFVRDTRARATTENKSVRLWSIRVRVDGADVLVRDKATDPADVAEALAALSIPAGAQVRAELEAYAYDEVSKSDYLWARRTFE